MEKRRWSAWGKRLAALGVALLVTELVSAEEPAGETENVLLIAKQVTTVRVGGKMYVPVEFRYAGREPLDEVEVKLYVHMQKGESQAVASGAMKIYSLTKGSHSVTGYVPERYVEQFGQIRKKHFEIWYKDKMRASLTEPRPKEDETWWQEKEGTEKPEGEGAYGKDTGKKGTGKILPVIEMQDIDIRELRRKIKDREED